MACYDGNYPVQFDPTVDKHIMEQRRARVESIGEALAKDDYSPGCSRPAWPSGGSAGMDAGSGSQAAKMSSPKNIQITAASEMYGP